MKRAIKIKTAKFFGIIVLIAWEYACRAGTETAYHTGAEISDDTGWGGQEFQPRLPAGAPPVEGTPAFS